MSIVDHLGLAVAETERSKAIYVKALSPLGIAVVMEGHGWVGMGRDGKPEFWIGGGDGAARGPVHAAFTAADRAQVRAFIEAVCHKPE